MRPQPSFGHVLVSKQMPEGASACRSAQQLRHRRSMYVTHNPPENDLHEVLIDLEWIPQNVMVALPFLKQ